MNRIAQSYLQEGQSQGSIGQSNEDLPKSNDDHTRSDVAKDKFFLKY